MKAPNKNFKMTKAERAVLAEFYNIMLSDEFFWNYTTEEICDLLDSIRLWEACSADLRDTYQSCNGITFELED